MAKSGFFLKKSNHGAEQDGEHPRNREGPDYPAKEIECTVKDKNDCSEKTAQQQSTGETGNKAKKFPLPLR